MRLLPLVPTRTGAAAPPVSRRTLRKLLALLAAGHMLAVCVGLPMAETRDLLDGGVVPAAARAGFHLALGAHPVGNPDDDLSDAIPVCGLIVFPSPVPLLDVPREAPDVLVGEPETTRPRVICTRGDFQRGPPLFA